MPTPSTRQVGLAHDNSLAKGDCISASLACSRRRLIYYLVKAAYSVHRSSDLIKSISEKISTENTVFGRLCKNRMWWGRAVSRGKFSARGPIQQYICQSDRTSGLGGTSTSLSFFFIFSFFLSARTLLTPRGYSFLDIAMKLCRRIALGEE